MPSPFWTSEHETAASRIQDSIRLLEADHKLVLHASDGGWKMPIYVGLNWLGRMSRTYSTFTWRRMPVLTTDTKEAQPVYDSILGDVKFWQLATPSQRRISAVGSTTLKLSASRRFKRPILRQWGEDEGQQIPGEFVWWERDPGDDPFAVSFYREEVVAKWHGKKDVVFRIRERFELDGDRILVTNEARLRSEADSTNPTPVDLAEILSNPPQAEEILQMDCLPAFRILNGESGQSDYTTDKRTLQRALTSSYTTYTIAVLMSNMPQLKFPMKYANPDGTIDLSKMLVTLYDSSQGLDEEAFTLSLAGNNFNMDNIKEYIEGLDRAYYQLTGISPAIDGISLGGSGESGYARRLGMVGTECGVEARRKSWDAFWVWCSRATPQLMRTQKVNSYDHTTKTVSAAWDEAIPPDTEAQSQDTERAHRGGYMSTYTAIARTNPDWSEDQINAEIARIENERQEAARRQMESFAGIPG